MKTDIPGHTAQSELFFTYKNVDHATNDFKHGVSAAWSGGAPAKGENFKSTSSRVCWDHEHIEPADQNRLSRVDELPGFGNTGFRAGGSISDEDDITGEEVGITTTGITDELIDAEIAELSGNIAMGGGAAATFQTSVYHAGGA